MGWFVAMLVSVAAALCSVIGVGPGWLDQAGAITICTTYTAALAARIGGRPLVFGALALALGLTTVLTGSAVMAAGAAVLTSVAVAVLAVMITTPAVRFRHAVRETLLALLVAGVGAFGVVGFRPVVARDRFDYLSLTLAFLLAVVLVYRLGAGLHGLGRRGLVVVLVGSVAVGVTLAYGELLRRYGSSSLIDDVFDAVSQVRETLGGVPRPLQVLVGVPALLWGTHMRARRRQGWWVTAFGVASTASVAGLLMNPDTGWIEALLIVVYSTIPGLVIGFLVIRADLLLTGPRGRRARREEEQTAVRPEPRRFASLF